MAGYEIRLWRVGDGERYTVDPKTYPTEDAARAELTRTLKWDQENARSEAFPHAGAWAGGTVAPRA